MVVVSPKTFPCFSSALTEAELVAAVAAKVTVAEGVVAAAAVAVAAVVDRLREYVRTGCKENRLTSARAASPLDMPCTLLLPPFTRLTTAEGLERSEKRIFTPSARRI